MSHNLGEGVPAFLTLGIYRQSPVKTPDIKNLKVVTFTFYLNKVPHCMEVTYTRAKVPNSFSRRMKLLCNTLVEHDKVLVEFKLHTSQGQSEYQQTLTQHSPSAKMIKTRVPG